MDFDEFEAQQNAEAERNKEALAATVARSEASNGILDQFEEWESWEDYMNYGVGGRPGRDHFGFHLPHRTRNEEM